MTPQQREKAVARAVKALDRAADALADVERMALEINPGIDMAREEHFVRELRERARYWERCTWWKSDARHRR